MVKLEIIGNLGKDPEVRQSKGGTSVCTLRVACTEKVKKGDNWEDHTEWVSVVTFGKTAENAGKYLAKGRQIYAEGRLQTSEWKDKDGKSRFNVEIVANTLKYIGGNGKGGAAQEQPSADSGPTGDDDIPF
jgi:single-strand DNA-binding protein